MKKGGGKLEGGESVLYRLAIGIRVGKYVIKEAVDWSYFKVHQNSSLRFAQCTIVKNDMSMSE